jgi:phage repressor protein C with HTH and peptisase S24 domain
MSVTLPPARRLQQLRLRAGYSLEALARLLGYARASSIQRYESETYYSSEFLPLPLVRKLAEVLPGCGKPPIGLNEVWSLAGVKADAAGQLTALQPQQLAEPSRSEPAAQITPVSGVIPYYGPSLVGEGDILELSAEPDDLRLCPPALLGVRDAYLLYVSGESMLPRYAPGTVLHVHPHLQPKAGRGVVVRLTRGRALISEYVRRQAGQAVLRQLNTARDIRLPAAQIVAIHTIVGTDEA